MRTVVIGAGIAGLATATLLAREGHRVTLVERTGEVGGRAGSLAVDGFRWDTGPSWYLMPEAFDRFFAAAGTSTAEQLDLVRLDPSYRVYPEGADPVDVPAGREAAAALFDALEPGGGAALRRYLDSGRLAYTVAVRRFLYTTFSSPRPFLHRDVLGHVGLLRRLLLTPLDRWAAGFVRDRRLRQILTYNAVFLASRPSATPALYHLLSHADMDQGVFYPRGGFAAVVDALHGLARDAGVEILTDTEVTSVDVADGRVTGVTTSAGRIPAGTVVSSADLHHTETALLAPGQRTWPERRWRHRDPGPGAVVVMLGVRGRLPELAHHTLFFSRDWDADFREVFEGEGPDAWSRSVYVSRPSATDPTVAPAGHENLFVLVPVPADPATGHGDAYAAAESPAVGRIADAAVRLIARRTGVTDLAERTVVRRTLGPADFAERYHSWRGGALGLAHTLRQSAFLRGSNASRKVDGLYYSGATTLPGVGVPMCLISAENVLLRLRR